jgi:MoxR-like ATPase
MPAAALTPLVDAVRRLEQNVGRALVGKPDVVRLAVVGLLARGHLLIEDVPGVGKTTLAAALARSIGVGFQRIQFTSDMLPSDILGVSIYQADRGEFVFKPGPLFTNVVLADEINRTTPKTQSSLLEAMNEAQVSLDHSTYPLPRPFMVLATQNPLEYEGTHPLPESQLDRFLLRLRIGYPARADERAILRGEAASSLDTLLPVVDAAEVEALQDATERVRADDAVLDYVLALVTATRTSPLLALGVSPRGALALVRAARAHALADGRGYLVPDDVKRLAVPALAHRVLARARLARPADGVGSEHADGEAAVRAIVQQVPVPR